MQSEPRTFHKSLTVRGAVAMAVAFCMTRVGIDLPDGVAQAAVDATLDLLFALGALGVGVGRARATQPLH